MSAGNPAWGAASDGPPPTQFLRLDFGAGEHLALDLLPGSAPGYLFLHGLGSVRNGEKSTSLFAHAARTGRAAARFDFRGHGESSGQLGQVTIRELIDDTLLVLERTGPCVVVGSSLGGLVGAFASAARPELVRGLALLAPALGFLTRIDQRVDADGRMWTSEGRSFVLSERVVRDARTLDERALPARLTMPTLVVHGTADEVVPPAASEHFHAALASSRKDLWIVPDGNHRLNAQKEQLWPRLDQLVACWPPA